MLIPMFDTLNLGNVCSSHELVQTELHMTATPEDDYYSTSKYMNDYTIVFNEQDYKGDKMLAQKVRGNLNKSNFEQNKRYTSIKQVKQAI